MDTTRTAEERDGQSVLGLVVLDISSGRSLGKLTELGVDVSKKAVSDLVVDDGSAGRRDRRSDGPGARWPFSVVEAFGPEAVTVWAERAAPDEQGAPAGFRGESEPRDASRVAAAGRDGRISSSRLVGRAVYSADGRKLGDVEDIRFHARDGRLTGLLLAVGQRRRGGGPTELLPADQVRVVGPDAVVAEATAMPDHGDEATDSRDGEGNSGDRTDAETQKLERGMEETLARAERLSREWGERLKESSAIGQRFAGERIEQVRHLMDEASTEVQRRWNGWRQQWQEMRNERESRSRGEVDADGILGKRADQTVTTEGGEIIVREGEVITSDHIQRARETHKLYALFLVAAMREIKDQMAEVEERFSRS